MLQGRIKGDFTLLVIVTGKIAVETLEDKITVTQWFGIERFVGQIDINNLKEERAAQGLIELLQDHAPTGINRSGGVELTQPLLVGMKGMTQTFVLCFRQGQAGMVADKEDLLVISGNGEVIVPDQDFVAIGSGGNYAYAAANGLFNHTDMTAEEIVRESLKIASSICVYTNDNLSVEKL